MAAEKVTGYSASLLIDKTISAEHAFAFPIGDLIHGHNRPGPRAARGMWLVALICKIAICWACMLCFSNILLHSVTVIPQNPQRCLTSGFICELLKICSSVQFHVKSTTGVIGVITKEPISRKLNSVLFCMKHYSFLCLLIQFLLIFSVALCLKKVRHAISMPASRHVSSQV